MSNAWDGPVPQFTKRDGSPMPSTVVKQWNLKPHVVTLKPPRPTVTETDKLYAIQSTKAPRIPWHKFIEEEFDWRPGEHVTMIGPTGEGKTTAMLGIIGLMPYTTVLSTKPKDSTLDQLQAEGYHRIERWRALDPIEYPRRLLWPDATPLDSTQRQKEVFIDAVNKMFREGSWCIAADELGYLTSHKYLGLSKEFGLLLIQGRSLNISLVGATQRPAWVPLEVYSQATHIFLWMAHDKDDMQRLSALNGRVDADVIRKLVNNLERHQILYVNTRTGFMCRTRAPEV